ncbi:MAG: hypothetical protein K8F52_05030 [Candidatus Scalindua rubra]|nr:hypothetical protein [Candidatus Scalindua rubra]
MVREEGGLNACPPVCQAGSESASFIYTKAGDTIASPNGLAAQKEHEENKISGYHQVVNAFPGRLNSSIIPFK